MTSPLSLPTVRSDKYPDQGNKKIRDFGVLRIHFLILPLLLANCALLNPTFSGEFAPLPSEWKNHSNFRTVSLESDLTHWWDSFSDPNLSKLIRLALASHPDLDSAQARIREARAQRKAAAASLFPFLSGSAGTNTSLSKQDNARRQTATRFSTGLDASWEADLFGKNRSNILAASYNTIIAEENLHSAQAALAAEVANAYTDLIANQARLDVLRRNISTQTETYEIADWRRQAGEADSLEALRSEASLEQSRSSLPRIEQSIEQNRNLLARLCGREPGGIAALLPNSKISLPHPARRLAISIPADTIRQRPDLRLANYQILATAAGNRAIRATRFPSLGLSGNIGLSSLSAEKLFRPQLLAAGVIANLSGPIFDAGRICAKIEASDAVLERTIYDYHSKVLTALSEVENALIACQQSEKQLDTLQQATKLAREADVLARQRYEAGEIDFLTVLDSQRTLLNLEDSLISTRADRTTAFIRLYQALGGGWTTRSTATTPRIN